MAKNQWREFERARLWARGLGLRNLIEWRAFLRSGLKPNDIPSNPEREYKGAFQGYRDWLGTENRKTVRMTYRPFTEARDFARALNLPDWKAWIRYCKAGSKPDDIPAAPNYAYGSEFESYADWLGLHPYRHRNRFYRSFIDARAYVRALGLESQKEWQRWIKSGDRPADIPSAPDSVYAMAWAGWDDWLRGDRLRVIRPSQFRSFDESRAFALHLGFRSKTEWEAWAKTEARPSDIPFNPDTMYSDRWVSWADWLRAGCQPIRDSRPSVYTSNFLRSLLDYPGSECARIGCRSLLAKCQPGSKWGVWHLCAYHLMVLRSVFYQREQSSAPSMPMP